MPSTLHLCIATGQNAANFIPLKQLQAQDIWVLETPEMQKQRSGKDLETALKAALPQALVRIVPFDDSTPQAMQTAALQLASEELDGKDVVFHAPRHQAHGLGNSPATAQSRRRHGQLPRVVRRHRPPNHQLAR